MNTRITRFCSRIAMRCALLGGLFVSGFSLSAAPHHVHVYRAPFTIVEFRAKAMDPGAQTPHHCYATYATEFFPAEGRIPVTVKMLSSSWHSDFLQMYHNYLREEYGTEADPNPRHAAHRFHQFLSDRFDIFAYPVSREGSSLEITEVYSAQVHSVDPEHSLEARVRCQLMERNPDILNQKKGRAAFALCQSLIEQLERNENLHLAQLLVAWLNVSAGYGEVLATEELRQIIANGLWGFTDDTYYINDHGCLAENPSKSSPRVRSVTLDSRVPANMALVFENREVPAEGSPSRFYPLLPSSNNQFDLAVSDLPEGFVLGLGEGEEPYIPANRRVYGFGLHPDAKKSAKRVGGVLHFRVEFVPHNLSAVRFTLIEAPDEDNLKAENEHYQRSNAAYIAAQYFEAFLSEHEQVSREDYKRCTLSAKRLLETAAKLGHQQAGDQLADHYRNGTLNLPVSPKKALLWSRLATTVTPPQDS